jgi:hypothetical protein
MKKSGKHVSLDAPTCGLSSKRESSRKQLSAISHQPSVKSKAITAEESESGEENKWHVLILVLLEG